MAARRKGKSTIRSKIDATPPWEMRVREEPLPTTGPWDERDAPVDNLPRVDLGALRIPVVPGIDVRLEMNESQQVIAATLVGRDGHLQLGVFAAPRNEGIWEDVRAEISSTIGAQKGSVRVHEGGPFGTELVGRLPGEAGGQVAVRFIGIDGPRWFLRAMLVGAVASDATKSARFEKALRDVIVVRGPEPLPAREPVALRLPKEILSPDGEEA
ncbi:MAG: DUF3710 domain-containing protein [Actinomycetota bacterium]|nr:DUF3710 domain-containing protein [Actinomycetota bacterium]